MDRSINRSVTRRFVSRALYSSERRRVRGRRRQHEIRALFLARDVICDMMYGYIVQHTKRRVSSHCIDSLTGCERGWTDGRMDGWMYIGVVYTLGCLYIYAGVDGAAVGEATARV